MTDYRHIRFERDGAIAVIELKRPDAANGLDVIMAAELAEVTAICADDVRLKAVILTARGRFFCAGGDLRAMHSAGEQRGEMVKTLADDLHGAIARLVGMQAVLIVAVNGVAAGAGFGLAICGDIVLAGESAGFTLAYTRAGLCPDGGSSYFLPRLVGLRRAQQMMLQNPLLSAAEAERDGLVTEVVADAELDARARELAQGFARGARLSGACVKKLLLAGAQHDLEAQMTLEGELISRCVDSPDGREGVQAFLDKRDPEFE